MGIISFVEDIKEDQVFSNEYDIAIFVCGSEPRCTNLAKCFSEKDAHISQALVLHISDATDDFAKKNRKRFSDLGYDESESIKIEDIKRLYQILNDRLKPLLESAGSTRTIRVFIDYSSMPRDWYAALLNWTCASSPENLVMVFGYSAGRYEREWEPKRCTQVRSIGDAGSVSNVSDDDETVIIGLGLDPDAPYTVQSSLDLKEAIAFITGPSVTKDVEKRVRDTNQQFINEYCSNYPLMVFPIMAVAEIYQCLSEITAVKHLVSTVVLVPLGPKPHVLASILVMHRYKNVVCIKVDHKHDRRYAVEASGDIVFTKVIIGK